MIRHSAVLTIVLVSLLAPMLSAQTNPSFDVRRNSLEIPYLEVRHKDRPQGYRVHLSLNAAKDGFEIKEFDHNSVPTYPYLELDQGMIHLPILEIRDGAKTTSYSTRLAYDRAKQIFHVASAKQLSTRRVELRESSYLLGKVFERAAKGQKTTIAALGGSITKGAGIENGANVYLDWIGGWWRNAFPTAEVELVNAGRSGSGSDVGAIRVQSHILNRNPDLVIIEFAVNDIGNPVSAESLEGIIRQLLKHPKRPAILLLYTTTAQLTNDESTVIPIGNHYDLPMISMKPILSHLADPQQFFADAVHPNAEGHKLIADAVIEYLNAFYRYHIEGQLPSPMTTNRFESATLLGVDQIEFTSNGAWTLSAECGQWVGQCLETEISDSAIEFVVSGQNYGLFYHLEKGDYGIARITIDGQEHFEIDAYFEDTKRLNAYAIKPLIENAASGDHHIRIQVVSSNPQSRGHRFRIYGVLDFNTKYALYD